MATMRRVLPEGRLSYGMQLPVQSQSTMYAEGWEAGAGPADLAEIARTADRLGFAYVGGLRPCGHPAPARAARCAPSGTTRWPPSASWPASPSGSGCSAMSPSSDCGTRSSPPSSTPPSTRSAAAASSWAWAPGTCRGVRRRSARTSRGAGPSSTRRSTRCEAALGPEEFPEHHGKRYDFAGLGQRPRPAQCPRAAALGGRFVARRRAPGRATGRRLAAAGRSARAAARADRPAPTAARGGGRHRPRRDRRHRRTALCRRAVLARRPPHADGSRTPSPSRLRAYRAMGVAPDPGALPQQGGGRTHRPDDGVRHGRRPASRPVVVCAAQRTGARCLMSAPRSEFTRPAPPRPASAPRGGQPPHPDFTGGPDGQAGRRVRPHHRRRARAGRAGGPAVRGGGRPRSLSADVLDDQGQALAKEIGARPLSTSTSAGRTTGRRPPRTRGSSSAVSTAWSTTPASCASTNWSTPRWTSSCRIVQVNQVGVFLGIKPRVPR